MIGYKATDKGGCRESYKENPRCWTFIVVMKKNQENF